eukprot:75532_1
MDEPSPYSDDFFFGHIITICTCLCMVSVIVLLVVKQYNKRYKWMDEYPSKYLFMYNHIADLIIWISMVYWYYKMLCMKQHYDEYCTHYNPIKGDDGTIISDPPKPPRFYSYCSIFDVSGAEYTSSPWPPDDKEYRINGIIGSKYGTIFMLLIYLGWQSLAQPLAFIVYTFCCDKGEVFEWIMVECVTVRSGPFFFICCCWRVFYRQYFKRRHYFYLLSCYCCIHKEFVPNVMILFSVGIHSLFVTYCIVVYETMRATEQSVIFKDQGVRDYEYYPVLVLAVQQFIVQMCYLFPMDKYHKEKEYKRATLYLVHKHFTSDIANLIIDYVYYESNETDRVLHVKGKQKIKLKVEPQNTKL